jgi:hypothetical protein
VHCSVGFLLVTVRFGLKSAALMWQVSSQPWFQPIRDQVQPDVVSRIGHLETSPTSRVSSSFSLPQQSEQSLTGIPLPSSLFIYRDNGQEQDSAQSDRQVQVQALFSIPSNFNF